MAAASPSSPARAETRGWPPTSPSARASPSPSWRPETRETLTGLLPDGGDRRQSPRLHLDAVGRARGARTGHRGGRLGPGDRPAAPPLRRARGALRPGEGRLGPGAPGPGRRRRARRGRPPARLDGPRPAAGAQRARARRARHRGAGRSERGDPLRAAPFALPAPRPGACARSPRRRPGRRGRRRRRMARRGREQGPPRRGRDPGAAVRRRRRRRRRRRPRRRARRPGRDQALEPGLRHKSEAGALALGLEGGDAVRAAGERLLALPEADGRASLLVEEMAARRGRAARRRPADGVVPALVVGLGGIWAEALDDVAIVPLPAEPGPRRGGPPRAAGGAAADRRPRRRAARPRRRGGARLTASASSCSIRASTWSRSTRRCWAARAASPSTPSLGAGH